MRSIVPLLVVALLASVTTKMASAFSIIVPAVRNNNILLQQQQQHGIVTSTTRTSTTALSMAKYNNMNEILALFPADKPVLVNFYDAKTEGDIKSDIFRAKQLLADRATLVSIKQQDYPELAKLWNADTKSPSMILFKDGQPITRIYEETHYLEIVAKVGKFCK